MASLSPGLERVDRVCRRLRDAEWLPQLLLRIFLGGFFCESGWGKIHNLDAFSQRFAEWQIPFPAFSAALSAYTEFIGGLLTVLGLCTRLVAIPQIINMAVAVVSVKLKDVQTVSAFFELDEPLYALGFLWLFFSGPGWVSFDHLIAKKLGLPSSRKGPPA